MNAPDLLQQDSVNRERALELASFIVEAPAGAGKTELLTQRFLKLLNVVSEPEEIVAITFTNKAAAEMRSRILDSLLLADARDVPALPHKRITYDLAMAVLERSTALQWELLAQPGRLRINTIDSLCSHLARQMPLMSRFGAQPRVTTDAGEHYSEAARRALSMLENEAGSGAVTEALSYLDNDTGRLTALLSEMLARRDQWLGHASRGALQEDVETALSHLVAQDIAGAAQLLTPDLQRRLMPVARYAAANLPDDPAMGLLLDWDELLPETPQALPLWRSVCELLLTQKDEFRKSLTVKQGFPAVEESKPYKAALSEIINAIPDARPLARIRVLPDARYGFEEWGIVGSLARLLQLAAAHLWAVFQESGEVDFIEVSQRALSALEDEDGATDLALRLDYQIRHLLVDEFQDTSPAQVALLEKLTAGWEPGDGRTLFCVGDPMQSIYRFRKADVGLFLQVALTGVGHLPLQRLNLTRNNRSCPAVVNWVNQAFERVFPETDSTSRGAIRYRPFAATRDALPGEGVEMHPLVLGRDDLRDEAAALEARYVANLIERERAEDPARTIAVLVRARTHLAALVAEIRRHRPTLYFQAVEIESLGGRQSVQDVLALTRAMLHRADRVHWLAVLRAPWCGLTLADLYLLAGDDHYSTVWQLMQDEARLARLSADGRQRLLHVRTVLQAAFDHQGRQPLRRWIESAWLMLGGAECLVAEGDVLDVQAFLGLVEQLEAGGRLTPAGIEAAMGKLYAAPDVRADGRLQFMTIHKSKGLEFDTVILPGLHRLQKKTECPMLLWEEVAIDDTGSHLIAAPWVPKHKRSDAPSAYDYLAGLEQERASNETARVLYVAATRTERRLHLVAALKPDAKGEFRPPSGTLLNLLWNSVGGAFLQHTQAALTEETAVVDEAAFVPRLIRLPRPAVPRALAEVPQARAGIVFDSTGGGDEGVLRFDASCGSLAHAYMEIMARDGGIGWSEKRLHDLEPAMRRWLTRQGHGSEESKQGAARVVAWLGLVLQSDDGRWILQAQAEAAAELAISSCEGATISSHVIDRTFIENGVRWVIDYKSTDLGPSASMISLQLQAVAHRAQLERYAGLFLNEGLPVRMGVFFLPHAQLVELKSGGS